MKFSFILPIYNIEKYLVLNCVESILKQSYKEIEIIVVNDGSNIDVGESEILFLEKKYSNLKYIYQKNKGVSIARNVGIDHTTGEYIIFVDSDDAVDINLCENLEKEIKEKKRIDLMIFGYTIIRDELGKCLNNEFIDESYTAYQLSIISQKESNSGYSLGAPWGKAIRREFILEHNVRFTPNVRKCQDRLFMVELFEFKPIVAYSNYIGYLYFVNPNSISNRYNPEIDVIMLFTLKKIHEFIVKYHNGEKEYLDAYNHLALQFILLVMRNKIFNKKNNKHKNEKVANLIEFLGEKDICQALKGITYHKLGMRRKVVLLLIRTKQYHIIQYVL